MIGVRASIVAVAATVALLALAHASGDPAPTHAAGRVPAFAPADTTIDGPAWHQLRQDATADEQRLSVQMWTVLAAGGAAALGLVLFLLRLALGWVKPPPPQEDAHQ